MQVAISLPVHRLWTQSSGNQVARLFDIRQDFGPGIGDLKNNLQAFIDKFQFLLKYNKTNKIEFLGCMCVAIIF